jgi:hypothetical protein
MFDYFLHGLIVGFKLESLSQFINMKLDTSGLESTAPFFGSSNELLDGFSAAPFFEVPNTTNVSDNGCLLYSLLSFFFVVFFSDLHERK